MECGGRRGEGGHEDIHRLGIYIQGVAVSDRTSALAWRGLVALRNEHD